MNAILGAAQTSLRTALPLRLPSGLGAWRPVAIAEIAAAHRQRRVPQPCYWAALADGSSRHYRPTVTTPHDEPFRARFRKFSAPGAVPWRRPAVLVGDAVARAPLVAASAACHRSPRRTDLG